MRDYIENCDCTYNGWDEDYGEAMPVIHIYYDRWEDRYTYGAKCPRCGRAANSDCLTFKDAIKGWNQMIRAGREKAMKENAEEGSLYSFD